MTNKKSNLEGSPKGMSNKKGESVSSVSEYASDSVLAKLRKQTAKLTYEESLNKLDSLLEVLQSDSVHLEELYERYLQGKIYLEHCEELLQEVEQKVSELDAETLNAKSEN